MFSNSKANGTNFTLLCNFLRNINWNSFTAMWKSNSWNWKCLWRNYGASTWISLVNSNFHQNVSNIFFANFRLATLMKNYNGELKLQCGAILISKQFMLTGKILSNMHFLNKPLIFNRDFSKKIKRYVNLFIDFIFLFQRLIAFKTNM
jgi:hypothetical protein